MTPDENKYAVPLDALVRSAYVPPEEQVEEHADPPPPDAVNAERAEQARLARLGGI